MAMTLRLPEALAERGRRHAAELGISLNGLLAIAVCEYLDARKPALRVAPPPRALAQAIASASFRPYHSTDVRGVEIGGAAKNVLAIAAGIVLVRRTMPCVLPSACMILRLNATGTLIFPV